MTKTANKMNQLETSAFLGEIKKTDKGETS